MKLTERLDNKLLSWGVDPIEVKLDIKECKDGKYRAKIMRRDGVYYGYIFFKNKADADTLLSGRIFWNLDTFNNNTNWKW